MPVYFLMRDIKGVDPDGRGSGEELGGVENFGSPCLMEQGFFGGAENFGGTGP